MAMQAPSSSYRRAPIYAFNVFPVPPRPRHRFVSQPPLQTSPVQAQVLMPDTFTVKLNRIHLRLLEEQRHHIHSLEHELGFCRQHMWAQATQLHSQSAQLNSQAAQITAMQQQLVDMQKGSTGLTVMQRLAALEQHRQHAEAHSAMAANGQPLAIRQGDLSARVADLEQHLGVCRADHVHAMSDLLDEPTKQLQTSTAATDADYAETSASDADSDITSDAASSTASCPPNKIASCSADDTASDTGSGAGSGTCSDTGSGSDSDIGSDAGSGTGSDSTPEGINLAEFAAYLDRRFEESFGALQQRPCKADSAVGEQHDGQGVKGPVDAEGVAGQEGGHSVRPACGVSTAKYQGVSLLELLQASGRDQYGSGGMWNGGVDNGFFD